MAKEDLGKLSPSQLKKLGKVISEAKDLTNQQAEIIEKVLAGEEDIGKLRISYLEEYFDIYSKKLDQIARKHSSLNDAFLVLDNKLTKSYRALASDVAKLEEQLSNISNKTENSKSASSNNTVEKSIDKTYTGEVIQEIKNILYRGVKLDEGQFNSLLSKFSDIKIDADQHRTLLETITSTAKEQIEKSSSSSEPVKHETGQTVNGSMTANFKDAVKDAYTFVNELYDRSILVAQSTISYEGDSAFAAKAAAKASTEAAATSESKPASATPAADGGQPPQPLSLPSVSVENTVSEQEIAALRETEATAKSFINFLDGVATDGIAIYTQEASIKDRQLKNNKALLESWAEQEKEIRKSMLNLAIAKLQTQEELENRSIELRLSRLKDATDAELAAQKLLNQIDLQLSPDTTKGAAKDLEVGDTRARKTNADINIKAYQELENQIADYRAKLDLETRLKNNGEINAAQAAANEEIVRQYFAARKDAIIKETREELLAKEQLARLGKTNPKVAQEYEKRLAEYRDKLNLESSRTNNGILTEEAARANEVLAQKYFADRKEALIKEIALEQQLNAEIAELAKVDPGLAQKREAEIAKYKADLEYEFMLANEGKLTEKAIEDIEKLANQKYAAEGAAMEKLAKLRLQEETENRYKEANPEAGAAFDTQRAKLIAEEERKLRQKNNRLLTKEEHDAIAKKYKEELALGEKNMKQLTALQKREDEKKKRADSTKTDQEIAHAVQLGGFSKEDNFASRMDSLKAMVDSVDDEDKGKAQFAVAVKALSSLVQQLESTIDKVGSYKGDIDTRMQGSSNKKRMGSYWDQLTTDMMSVGAVTPFFKQEDFANNIKELVNRGIAFDLKQRAFLMTIQEKIANTFNVADGTLLRLIRIQQEDSTAGRLGMESALNAYLNNMYETSEYLGAVAESVRGSLEEMEALMTGAAATEVEYQVQKWMGSLYSVGMSQNAVTAIANAIGQVASGQIDALTNGGAGNLLVMAANDAGIPIADILTGGLDAKETNKLLQATVNYLAEIAESSKGNNVVQQQLADVFGVKASDLRAATNLASKGTDDKVYGKYLTYDNMLKQLNDMANSMIMRTSVGEFMTNVWENAQYSIASSMANNPITYLTYKLAGLLDEAVGGIDLPFINVMGFGVDLNTTVADLMRVASVTGGILGSLGPMISGLANSFSGQAMLKKMEIGTGNGLTVTPRGQGDGIGGGGGNTGGGSKSTSSSGYVGNGDGNSVKDATIQESEDSKKQQMIEAKEEEPSNQVDVLNNTVIKIYELLDNVANGSQTLRVRVDNYGLTGTNSNSSNGLSNSLGSATSGSGSFGGGSGSSLGGTGGGGGSNGSSGGDNSLSSSGTGSVSLGGWTTI